MSCLPCFPGLKDGVANLGENGELISCWRTKAQAVAENRFNLLGVDWPDRNGMPDWHLDPVSGEPWPATAYCFDIPFRHDKRFSNIKYLWELGRLQYLQPVAALAALRNDEALAELCERHIVSWIDGNPPFKGVHWNSGIELACRAVSILMVTTLLDFKPLSSAFQTKVLTALAHHGYWLARFPSRFSSANNHLVAEAGGLYLLGSLLPQFGPAKQWKAYGLRTLEREVTLQFLGDGTAAEQSPTYAAFSLEWFLVCGQVGRSLGRPFSEDYWRSLVQAGRFLRILIDEHGNVPRIGDDDEGQVVCSSHGPQDYVGSVLTCLAAVTGLPDLAPPTGSSDLRHALCGRVEPSREKHLGVHHFRQGGYTIVRSEAKGTQHLLVIDHGPVGHLSIAAHGHADALAIWFHVGGRPVLVDSGTYLYHSGGDWRDHFRGTIAHNTLTIAGESSSAMAGDFLWSRKASVRLRRFCDDPVAWLVEAEHDGFLEEFGYLHRRCVERMEEGVFTVTDRLIGNGREQAVDIGFLFAPELTVEKSKDRWRIRDQGQALVEIQQAGSLHGELQRGSASPKRGWHSPGFSVKVPATRLAFVGPMRGDTPTTFRFSVP